MYFNSSIVLMHFEKLHKLASHLWSLDILRPRECFFFVWWCVRDILLGINNDPKDIDITCNSHPEILRDTLHKDTDGYGIFRTEKFGTITVVEKNTSTHTSCYTYELTPFREEDSYTDNRRPDAITWSSHILDDAKRRDFTTNCLYAYFCENIELSLQQDIQHIWDKYTHVLDTQGILFFSDIHVCIVQSHEHIQKLFGTCNIDVDYLHTCISSQRVFSYKDDVSNASLTNRCIICDPYQGIQDMWKGIIRTVNDADKRVTEDALRILRAIRFLNTRNQHHTIQQTFIIHKPTRQAMERHAHRIQSLAWERLQEELKKVFIQHNAFGYVILLQKLWVLYTIFPSLHDCYHNEQPTNYHARDTLTHSLLALYHFQQQRAKYMQDNNIPSHDKEDRFWSAIPSFAMLYHDVGKPEQYASMQLEIQKNPDNPDRSAYKHHTDIWVQLAQQDFKRLAFPKKDIQEICRYIQWHHRPGEILDSAKKKQEKKLRALLSDGGYKRTMNLIDIAIADRLWQYNPIQPPAIDVLQNMKITVQTLYSQEGRFTPQDLAINGHDIMKKYGLKPWPQIGYILNKCFERVLGDVQNRNNTHELFKHIRSLDL